MACIVVSRNGEGDVWAFPGMKAARLHPIPQMDDVYAANGGQLVAQYGRSAVRSLLRFVPEGADRKSCDDLLTSARWFDEDFGRYADLVWPHVKGAAKSPPEAAEEVVAVVKADRRAREGVVLRSFDPPLHEEDAPRRAVAPQSNADKEDSMSERDHFRMSEQGTITFGKDDKGVPYGADNNPMKGDEKKASFAAFKDGMTVEDALAIDGVDRSFVRRARRAGYIDIVNPPEEPKAEGEEKPKRGKKGATAESGEATEGSAGTSAE